MAREDITEIFDAGPSLDNRAEPVTQLRHDRDEQAQKEHEDPVRNDSHLNVFELIDHKTRIKHYCNCAEQSSADTSLPRLLWGNVRNYLMFADGNACKISKLNEDYI